MGDLFGVILRALGYALAGIYEAIPSYGIAIILLTIGVRVLLVPLTIKQIRGMTAMQTIQPQIKELQKKHKADRQKLNEELMKLYKEHGVNPLSGCLPLLAQMPVFIALFSVLRASIRVAPVVATLAAGGAIPSTTYTDDQLKSVICRQTQAVTVDGKAGIEILCEDTAEENPAAPQTFRIGDFRDVNDRNDVVEGAPSWITLCRPQRAEGGGIGFQCQSALGTGHVPTDSELFRDVTEDRATFLAMHLGCSATQVGSEAGVRQCTNDPNAGGTAKSIPYYALVALIIATSYYQARQMAKRATGQAAQQQMMMMKVLPVLFGFISLSIPAGTNVYFLVSNVWTIGQQAVLFRHQTPPPTNGAKPEKAPKPSKEQPAAKGGSKNGGPPPKPHPSKKKKKR